MLMRKPFTRLRARQLNLFHPPPKTPMWESLSAETRIEVVKLVAWILRDHRARDLGAQVPTGANDE
jgi:hypothetical protein